MRRQLPVDALGNHIWNYSLQGLITSMPIQLRIPSVAQNPWWWSTALLLQVVASARVKARVSVC